MNGVLKGKLLENETLVRQAANSKEQFANSPTSPAPWMSATHGCAGSPQHDEHPGAWIERVRKG